MLSGTSIGTRKTPCVPKGIRFRDTQPGTTPRFLTPIVTPAENSEIAVNYRKTPAKMASVARQSDLGRLGRSRPFILLYFRPWSDCPPKVRKTPKLEINQSIPGLETCLVSLPRFRCSGTAATRGCRSAFLIGVGYFPSLPRKRPHTADSGATAGTAVRVVCGKKKNATMQGCCERHCNVAIFITAETRTRISRPSL